MFSFVADYGQTKVRIDAGVAMSGEMFRRRDDPGLFITFERGQSMHAHLLRVITERSCANYRIARLAVDIEHRREVHRDADGAKLATGYDCTAFCGLSVASG